MSMYKYDLREAVSKIKNIQDLEEIMYKTVLTTMPVHDCRNNSREAQQQFILDCFADWTDGAIRLRRYMNGRYFNRNVIRRGSTIADNVYFLRNARTLRQYSCILPLYQDGHYEYRRSWFWNSDTLDCHCLRCSQWFKPELYTDSMLSFTNQLLQLQDLELLI